MYWSFQTQQLWYLVGCIAAVLSWWFPVTTYLSKSKTEREELPWKVKAKAKKKNHHPNFIFMHPEYERDWSWQKIFQRQLYIHTYIHKNLIRVDIHTRPCGCRWQGWQITIFLFTCNASIPLCKFAAVFLRTLLRNCFLSSFMQITAC